MSLSWQILGGFTGVSVQNFASYNGLSRVRMNYFHYESSEKNLKDR